MNDVLTMEEIEARYSGEWVLIEDPEIDAVQRVRRGRVRWHGQDPDEGWLRAREMGIRNAAVYWMGEMPSDIVFAL
jgi:hypothetical protein